MAVRELTDDELILMSQLRDYGERMPPLMYAQKLQLLAQIADEQSDIQTANMWYRRIVEYLTHARIAGMDSFEDQTIASVMLRNSYTYLGRSYFHYFLIAMDWNRETSKRFYEPRMRILGEVVQDLQDLADGKLDLYCLSMPPRTGKTTLGLLYTCWLGGRRPDKSILSAGYSSSLVQSFFDGCQEFITSTEYRFNDIFPSSPLVATSAKGLTIDLGKKTRYKTLTFRSIDGTVTGATEANSLLYLDDLVSGIEEAMNINRMDTLWMKVSSDLLQRKKKGCPMLVIGTRWSIHDPLGRIEAKYEDDPRAKFKSLAAVDEHEHSNFDYSYDVGFDDNHYKNLKSMTDPVTWECVYMQNPIERDGLLFPDLKRYLELPRDKPDDVFAFCDVAFGGSDYLSMPIAYQWGDDIYIVDVVFMKGGYEVTEPVVVGKLLEHNVSRALFEANNGGDFYSRDVMDMIKEKGRHCNILSLRAPSTQSKLSRIIQHSPAIKTFYFKDIALIDANSMYQSFMGAMGTFTQTGKNKHDDAPDSCAGLANMCRRFTMQRPDFLDRKNIGW